MVELECFRLCLLRGRVMDCEEGGGRLGEDGGGVGGELELFGGEGADSD